MAEDSSSIQDDAHQDEFEREEDMFHPDQVPRLAEDGSSPAAEPTDVLGRRLPPDDPRLDAEIDEDERYQYGSTEASGAQDTEEDLDTGEEIVEDQLG